MATIEDRVANFQFKVWLRKNRKTVIFLVLLVCLAYGNSLKGDFVSDDTRSILNNPNIDRLDYAFRESTTFLRPLFYFAIKKTFGLNPLFFRLVNIFFHLGTVLIIYLLVNLLINPKVALFSAAILAVHPIQTEAISWITGGIYVQYSFFLVLSLLLYSLSLKNRKLFFVSVACFILALLSSVQAAVFPLIVFLFVFSFDSLRKNWKRLSVFFAIAGIWVVANLFKITDRITTLENSFYKKPELLNPFIQVPIAITSYLELIFWPKGLTLYHSEMAFSQSEYIIRLILFIIFLGIAIFSFKKRREIFFWLSFFVASLLTFLTPFGISWIVAERYVYLGAMGIFVIIALGIQRLGEIKKLKMAANLLFVLIIIALSLRTFGRNIDWRNEDNLWLATAKTSPSSPNTHNNLGDVYSRRGDLERAASEFKLAIRIKPGYADAYHNLAHTYQRMGKILEAADSYQKAIHFNPNLWQSHQNLAGIYYQQKKFVLAKENLENAVKANPNNPGLLANLGIAYLALGEKVQAEDVFQQALSLDPDSQMAKKGLGLLKTP
ncbi:tetratricopeptide repeat protein [Candidatus Omnitrophota bacterium]